MKQLAFAEGLSLPIDVVTQKIAFMGRTGSGKTYAATKLAELLLRAGAQVVALDPVGVWWGLRLEADGKTPSDLELPIFGGLHGDIPLESTGGKLMADLVVDRALSCVLDVSQFESDAEKARFARDFADRFFYRKKAAPSAVHLFLEEAQEFVPQNPQRDDAKMLHVFERLIKLGRNFGIGVSLVSQRPQELNKKALNQTELLLAFQMTGPQERKAISAWVSEKGADEDVADILPGLKVGQPHVWSPQWLGISKTVKVIEKLTYNASSTPTFGAKAIESKPLGAIDLSQLQERMAATIEKAKATDPKLLQQRVAILTKQLDSALSNALQPRGIIDPKAVQKAVAQETKNLRRALEAAMKFIINVSTQNFDVAGVDKAELEKAVLSAVGKATDVLDRQLGARTLRMQQLKDSALQISNALRAALNEEEVVVNVAVQKNEPFTVTAPRPTRAPREPRPLTDGLSGAQQKILDAIATLNELGVEQPTLVQVALFVGVSHTTGSYQQNVRNLGDAGYLERGSGQVSLTAVGKKSAQADADRDPIEFWKQKLPGAQSKLLALILEQHPAPISKEELAVKAGVSHTTGSYQQNLRDMRTYGIVDIESGQVAASELLFPHAYA